MKSIRAVLRPDALPGVNHMRGMQYQIVLNIRLWSELIELYKYVCTILTQNSNSKLCSKPPFSRLLRHTWLKAVICKNNKSVEGIRTTAVYCTNCINYPLSTEMGANSVCFWQAQPAAGSHRMAGYAPQKSGGCRVNWNTQEST